MSNRRQNNAPLDLDILRAVCEWMRDRLHRMDSLSPEYDLALKNLRHARKRLIDEENRLAWEQREAERLSAWEAGPGSFGCIGTRIRIKR